MKDRKEVLASLLNFEYPIARLRSELAVFPWDSEELVLLTVRHIQNILEQFVGGSLSAGEVEEWADTIELRDDIGFEQRHEPVIKELIHELANPWLTQPLTRQRGHELVSQCRSL